MRKIEYIRLEKHRDRNGERLRARDREIEKRRKINMNCSRVERKC